MQKIKILIINNLQQHSVLSHDSIDQHDHDPFPLLYRINALRMHIPGSYRRLIAYPKQLSWRWVPPSELVAPPKFRDNIGPGTILLNQQQTTGERDGGKNTAASAPAMELSFSLETNCFATVFLREVMKQQLQLYIVIHGQQVESCITYYHNFNIIDVAMA